MRDSVGFLAGAVRRLQAAHGWRRPGLALVLGALAALAVPPLFIFPLLILGLTALLLLIDNRRSPFANFATGWWWGFGHFLVAF